MSMDLEEGCGKGKAHLGEGPPPPPPTTSLLLIRVICPECNHTVTANRTDTTPVRWVACCHNCNVTSEWAIRPTSMVKKTKFGYMAVEE